MISLWKCSWIESTRNCHNPLESELKIEFRFEKSAEWFLVSCFSSYWNRIRFSLHFNERCTITYPNINKISRQCAVQTEYSLRAQIFIFHDMENLWKLCMPYVILFMSQPLWAWLTSGFLLCLFFVQSIHKNDSNPNFEWRTNKYFAQRTNAVKYSIKCTTKIMMN